jgi:hypothetical protein
LHAVHVTEPNSPAGEEPIEWMLFTSEKVDSYETAVAIVDHYRARWVIEEYFKALKTGCAFEKRQLTSYEGLTKALALFVPIAWQLLRLRHLSREEQSPPARHVLDTEQLLLLRALLSQRKQSLVDEPTVRDVMLAMARLGGHIRNNRAPAGLSSAAVTSDLPRPKPYGASPGATINLELAAHCSRRKPYALNGSLGEPSAVRVKRLRPRSGASRAAYWPSLHTRTRVSVTTQATRTSCEVAGTSATSCQS